MKDGLLLINLGSPDQPTNGAVRRYLRQFLMDKHVIDVHWSLRSLLVHGLIAPTRAPKSARAYQSVWRPEGAPLLHFSRQFTANVQEILPDTQVELAMRYGRPSVRSALERLRAAGVERLKAVPLYPQFAKSSTLTAIEAVTREQTRMAWGVKTTFLRDFFAHPAWIQSLAQQITQANADFGADFLLLSFHGLPEHHIQEFDKSKGHCLAKSSCCDAISPVNRNCYRAQCFATSRAVLSQLQWPVAHHKVSFQSRLGRRPWIKPYSDHVIVELAKSGVEKLLVTCPSFVADCLETLEEVSIRMRKDFIAAGGKDLRLVPAVNESIEWVQGFATMLADPQLPWEEARP